LLHAVLSFSDSNCRAGARTALADQFNGLKIMLLSVFPELSTFWD